MMVGLRGAQISFGDDQGRCWLVNVFYLSVGGRHKRLQFWFIPHARWKVKRVTVKSPSPFSCLYRLFGNRSLYGTVLWIHKVNSSSARDVIKKITSECFRLTAVHFSHFIACHSDHFSYTTHSVTRQQVPLTTKSNYHQALEAGWRSTDA